MSNITLVSGHPSDKVVTFNVDHDFLGPFEKIAIPKGSKLAGYSPLAQSFFERPGDLIRMDFFARDNNTTVSVARKLVPWNDNGRRLANDLMHDFFDRRKNVPPVFLEALQADFTSEPAFDPGPNPIKNMVQKTFFRFVNPILARDGGSAELKSVEINSDGEVVAEVFMLGSCNGCTSALTSTLNDAATNVRTVLDEIKRQHPDNPKLQKLKFMDIEVRNSEGLIFSKN